MYPAEIVLPMKAELTDEGFSEMLSASDVDNTLKMDGTTLVVINSVCGCAAGTCRPGVVMAVQNAVKRPDRLATSFAGFDIEAVNKVRELSLPYPPSSPCIALFKDGILQHMIERHHIEGRTADMIAAHLNGMFEEFC